MPVRILVVDDSAFMRLALTKMIQADPNNIVVGTADNGAEALEKVRSLRPDVVTMDVDMPKMDGVTALGRLMRDTPVSVLMVSSLTEQNAELTLKCLQLGAVDFLTKDRAYSSVAILDKQQELLQKIRVIAQHGPRRDRETFTPPPVSVPVQVIPLPRDRLRRVDVIVLGASTGGPIAVQRIVACLPGDLPVPVLVVQHMPSFFVSFYAETLRKISQLAVHEAGDGEELRSGICYLASGGKNTGVSKGAPDGKRYFKVGEAAPDSLYKPSIDATMISVAAAFGARSLVVILTGMGSDGVEGIKAVRKVGGVVIAQDEQSCIIPSMPRHAVESGAVDTVLPLEEIATKLVHMV